MRGSEHSESWRKSQGDAIVARLRVEDYAGAKQLALSLMGQAYQAGNLGAAADFARFAGTALIGQGDTRGGGQYL